MNLRERLRRAIQQIERGTLQIEGFRQAAVLVPIVEREHGASLVFTARPKDMPTHAGQISFPGGGWESADLDLRTTALREAAEEIGIEAPHVDVLGQLDDVATPLGFVITPVVGMLTDPPPFRPDPREVEACFEIRISTISNPDCFTHRGERTIAGRVYPLPEYHVEGRVIWGATARIVQRLLELLDAAG